MASLEQQLLDLIETKTRSDPIAFGLAHGTLSAADLPAGLTAEQAAARKDEVMVSVLGAYRECIVRLSRAIDDLQDAQARSASSGLGAQAD